MSLYLLAAVRREHRRLTVVCQRMDRRQTPPGVVALIEDAMLTLDDAAKALEQQVVLHAAEGPCDLLHDHASSVCAVNA